MQAGVARAMLTACVVTMGFCDSRVLVTVASKCWGYKVVSIDMWGPTESVQHTCTSAAGTNTRPAADKRARQSLHCTGLAAAAAAALQEKRCTGSLRDQNWYRVPQAKQKKPV